MGRYFYRYSAMGMKCLINGVTVNYKPVRGRKLKVSNPQTGIEIEIDYGKEFRNAMEVIFANITNIASALQIEATIDHRDSRL